MEGEGDTLIFVEWDQNDRQREAVENKRTEWI